MGIMIDAVIFWGGAVFSSLMNFIAYRYVYAENFSIRDFFSFSQCESCHKKVDFIYLMPIFGFLISMGRCNKCHKKIPIYHFLSEIFSGLFCLVMFYCLQGKGVVIFSLLFSFIVISWVDLKTKTIPFLFTIPIFILGFYFPLQKILLSEQIYGALCGFILTMLAMFVVSLAKKENVFAGGDVALIICAGIWLGLSAMPFFILITSLIFITYALPERIAGGKYSPMGPSICMGFTLCILLQLIC